MSAVLPVALLLAAGGAWLLSAVFALAAAFDLRWTPNPVDILYGAVLSLPAALVVGMAFPVALSSPSWQDRSLTASLLLLSSAAFFPLLHFAIGAGESLRLRRVGSVALITTSFAGSWVVVATISASLVGGWLVLTSLGVEGFGMLTTVRVLGFLGLMSSTNLFRVWLIHRRAGSGRKGLIGWLLLEPGIAGDSEGEDSTEGLAAS